MATRPDSNVRPARHPAAQSATAARRFALARLLLGMGAKLLLLAAVSSSMPACIIPVGPSWQDPPGDPDSQPQIVESNPDFLAAVTANPNTNEFTFKFTVTDPNPAHDLWFQAVIDDDHPGMIAPTMEPKHPDGSLIHKQASVDVTCNYVNRSQPIHKVVAAVADKAFRNDEFLVLTDPTGKMTLIGWTLSMDCPPQGSGQ